MAPRGHSLFWDGARFSDLIIDVLVLLAVMAAVALAACLLAWWIATAGGSLIVRRRVRQCMSRRMIHSFAAAVAVGDMAIAEIQARRVLRGNDPTRLARRHVWDERVVLDCSWAEGAAYLQELDTVARWFPSIRRTHDDGATDLRVGPHGHIQLRLVSEKLVPGESVRFAADADGSVIIGHLTLLYLPVVSATTTDDRAEVWVHAEGPHSRRSRRALRATRSTTRVGLRRWASALRTA